eukprot:Pompholyxophrys_punicea_v1_NODE_1_length_14747_cov_12.267901.p16 type:complete len:101 gc:universal NODE_1_length_14747_cov_12.267901:13947-14249(+)
MSSLCGFSLQHSCLSQLDRSNCGSLPRLSISRLVSDCHPPAPRCLVTRIHSATQTRLPHRQSFLFSSSPGTHQPPQKQCTSGRVSPFRPQPQMSCWSTPR